MSRRNGRLSPQPPQVRIYQPPIFRTISVWSKIDRDERAAGAVLSGEWRRGVWRIALNRERA